MLVGRAKVGRLMIQQTRVSSQPKVATLAGAAAVAALASVLTALWDPTSHMWLALLAGMAVGVAFCLVTIPARRGPLSRVGKALTLVGVVATLPLVPILGLHLVLGLAGTPMPLPHLLGPLASWCVPTMLLAAQHSRKRLAGASSAEQRQHELQ